jgi:fatty acid desaturase
MSTPYEPMAEVRKNFRISWYRCPAEPAKLKELTRRSDLKGLYQGLGHLLLIAATGTLTYYLFLQQIWVGFAFALVAHGSVFTFLRAGRHELSHGTVFRSKWLNSFFLRTYSVLCWLNSHRYKMSHTYHHMYTLHPRGDREVVLPQFPTLNPLYLFQLFTLNVTGGPESKGLIPSVANALRLAFLGKFANEWEEAIFAEDQAAARTTAANWSRFMLLFHAAVIVVSILLKLWLLPVLITFAPFIGNWWRYFVGFPMHAGLRDNVADFRLCVRTITLDPISKFLYWRMNYHTEHHMYAAVPCYNLRKLQKEIQWDMPKPRSLIEAWREMRTTWKKQQTDPTYQLDTPLPKHDKGPVSEKDPLADSLGDLAPDTLTEDSGKGQ